MVKARLRTELNLSAEFRDEVTSRVPATRDGMGVCLRVFFAPTRHALMTNEILKSSGRDRRLRGTNKMIVTNSSRILEILEERKEIALAVVAKY